MSDTEFKQQTTTIDLSEIIKLFMKYEFVMYKRKVGTYPNDSIENVIVLREKSKPNDRKV